MNESSYAEVARTLQRYFDALYFGDTSMLASVFHARAHYVCATDTPMTHLTMREYFAVVQHRQSPATRGEERRDAIEAIAFAGPSTAFVRARCAIGRKYFTDFLTLVLTEDRWQIISKVFHYVTH